MSTTKGSEEIMNEDGAVETKVETVDYRSSAGHESEPPKKEDVEVTHVYRTNDAAKNPAGILADAAAAVNEHIIQPVKDATSRTDKSQPKQK